MFTFSRIKLLVFVGIVCIVITINTLSVTAQDTSKNPKSSNLSESCITCADAPKCLTCSSGQKCVLTLRTCHQCPQPRCGTSQNSSDAEGSDTDPGNNKLLPGVIGGILGVGVLTTVAYCYIVYKRKLRDRGIKLDGGEEMTSTTTTTTTDSENVIQIAYTPPTTPDNSYSGTQISAGTTSISSPMHKKCFDRLIDFVEDDDPTSDIGTILQATKSTPVAATTTATLITATRAKPALVRLNSVKSSSSNGTNNSSTAKSFLITPLIPLIPLTPNSSIYTNIGTSGDNTNEMLPRIDIERSSSESSRPPFSETPPCPTLPEIPSQQHLNLSFLDPIEGRQSFGLFGSDEVFSTGSTPSQLERVSVMSSSTNGRSTMFSDEGDGEIMIFWGGNERPLSTVTGENVTITQMKDVNNEVNSTENVLVKTKEDNI